jgi:4-amino-4-deoxy-L-arabinose transferase-like glycosyltransferase
MKSIRPLLRSVLLVAIICLGLALRLMPWHQNRFLEDEALYAYWGLQIASGADPMLDKEPVDKPPLFPYTVALSYLLFSPPPDPNPGPSTRPLQAGEDGWLPTESPARLPSLLASLAGIALVYALGRALYNDDRVGLLAALLLALSPFDILFAPTAFTDPLMTAFLLGALLAAARRRLVAAGLLAGLAAATKQQGLLFLPLVVIFGLWATVDRPRRSQSSWLSWLGFVLAFVTVAAGVVWWNSTRLQRPGFWEQGLISYGGLHPAQPLDLVERAAAWLQLAGSFWPSIGFNALMLGAFLLWLIGSLFVTRIPKPGRLDLLLVVFVIGYLLLHSVIGFQIWDRYLLPLVPLVALLAARAFISLGEAIPTAAWQRLYAVLLGVAIIVFLFRPLVMATRSELPLGGDHGAYDGIDEIADYIRLEAPPGSVLYHYWLGYHHRFYLYGAPLRLHWYPDLNDLTADSYVYRREPRYIAVPSWRDGAPAAVALGRPGITLELVHETTRRDGTVSFRLYRLEGPHDVP